MLPQSEDIYFLNILEEMELVVQNFKIFFAQVLQDESRDETGTSCKEHIFLYMGIRKTLLSTRRTEDERHNKHVSCASHASPNVLGNLFITLPQFLHRTGH